MKQIMLLIAILSIFESTRLEAKVLTLTPVQYGAGTAASDVPEGQTATLAQTGDEMVVSEIPLAEAFLKFDLTLVQEAGRPINMVALEWPVNGVFPDSVTTYSLYAVPDSVIVAGGQPPATSEEDLVVTWNLAPIDIVRSGGATVLFDLTDLAKEWVSGAKSNNGIVIKTRALDEDGLRAQLSQARLVIR